MSWWIDLIKEFPQASVLKERLALQDQQFALIVHEKDTAITERDDTIVRLQAENAELRLLVEKANEENRIIKDKQQKLLHSAPPNIEAQSVLLHLSKHPTEQLSADQVASGTRLPLAKTLVALKELEQQGYSNTQASFGGPKHPAMYSISSAGLAHLNTEGLL